MNFSDSEKFTALSLAKASEIIYTEDMKTILTILLCLTTLAGCTPAPESGMDIYTFSIGKADAIVWLICNAFGMSITTFVGQNFGARNYAVSHQ